MFDTSLLLMANMVTEYLNSGWEPKPMGNEAQSGSPSSGMYQTKTTPLLLAANTNDQFSGLCDASFVQPTTAAVIKSKINKFFIFI